MKVHICTLRGYKNIVVFVHLWNFDRESNSICIARVIHKTIYTHIIYYNKMSTICNYWTKVKPYTAYYCCVQMQTNHTRLQRLKLIFYVMVCICVLRQALILHMFIYMQCKWSWSWSNLTFWNPTTLSHIRDTFHDYHALYVYAKTEVYIADRLVFSVMARVSKERVTTIVVVWYASTTMTDFHFRLRRSNISLGLYARNVGNIIPYYIGVCTQCGRVCVTANVISYYR